MASTPNKYTNIYLGSAIILSSLARYLTQTLQHEIDSFPNDDNRDPEKILYLVNSDL